MLQTFFNAVLLCGVGYALYKKVIQMLKDIDEKYEGKLKTLVFELEVKHQVSINQLLKDIDEKYELNVNHQEIIQKLENTIEYNLEHTETLEIDLNNKLRLLKNELLDKVKEDLVVSEDKIKDKVKEDLVLLEDKIKEDLVLSEDKVKDELKTELLDKVKNELEIKDQENIQTLKTKEFENALDYCGVGDTACHMSRFFDFTDYRKGGTNILTYKDGPSERDTQLTLGWSENMVRCFNSSERIQQINRSEFYVKCDKHNVENEKNYGIVCRCRNQTPCQHIRAQLYDATIIEINNKKYILSKFICSTKNNSDEDWHCSEKRTVYNMKKALLFNYEPDFKPKFEHNISYQETYKWYQVGSIDRITKEIIWESNHEPKLEPKPVPIQEPIQEPVLKIRVNRINIFGKKYFKTITDGIIYDADTMNEVGKQDQITGAYNINLNKPIKTGKLEDINNIIIL